MAVVPPALVVTPARGVGVPAGPAKAGGPGGVAGRARPPVIVLAEGRVAAAGGGGAGGVGGEVGRGGGGADGGGEGGRAGGVPRGRRPAVDRAGEGDVAGAGVGDGGGAGQGQRVVDQEVAGAGLDVAVEDGA